MHLSLSSKYAALLVVETNEGTLVALRIHRKTWSTWRAELPSKRALKRKAKLWFRGLVDVVTRREVHYWYSSTDCDHTHVEYAVKYSNIKEAREVMEEEYESCEGATYFNRISRAEFEECQSERVQRDYVLEAHEGGNSYSVKG
jgi:hypothetical protein